MSDNQHTAKEEDGGLKPELTMTALRQIPPMVTCETSHLRPDEFAAGRDVSDDGPKRMTRRI